MLVIDLIFQSDPYSLKDLSNQVEENLDRDLKKFGLCPDELSWFIGRDLISRMGDESGCREDGNCGRCLYDWLLSEARFKEEKNEIN